jgi:hypothetical protein
MSLIHELQRLFGKKKPPMKPFAPFNTYGTPGMEMSIHNGVTTYRRRR